MPGRVVRRVLLRVTLVLAALGAIGAAVSRRRNVGGAESDEFSIAAIFGAPVIEPHGNKARKRSNRLASGKSAEMVDTTCHSVG